MILDTKNIIPLKGHLECHLFENEYIGLPLTLYYTIEIPLKPFDSGHNYVDQPTNTSVIIEWIKFCDKEKSKQAKNWKNLVGQEFDLSYKDETAEGSIYLGSEHCQIDSKIKFLALKETIFDVELEMVINFNIEVSNLSKNGRVIINTQIEFIGFILYDFETLPSLKSESNLLKIIDKYIDLNVYETQLNPYKYGNYRNADWKQLKPRK